MRKLNNIPKYIQKLKNVKQPQYIVGQETGLGLREVIHPGKKFVNISI